MLSRDRRAINKSEVAIPLHLLGGAGWPYWHIVQVFRPISGVIRVFLGQNGICDTIIPTFPLINVTALEIGKRSASCTNVNLNNVYLFLSRVRIVLTVFCLFQVRTKRLVFKQFREGKLQSDGYFNRMIKYYTHKYQVLN